jgi:hypothetical protein
VPLIIIVVIITIIIIKTYEEALRSARKFHRITKDGIVVSTVGLHVYFSFAGLNLHLLQTQVYHDC